MGTGLGKEKWRGRKSNRKDVRATRGTLGRDGVNDIKEPSIGCEIHIVYVAT